ncbi:MAG: threonine/serine dehydratase [Alphaproteobacteria bacterium]|nr:threonine/serine dehydratase [Alphaproteobacteria bacterium]
MISSQTSEAGAGLAVGIADIERAAERIRGHAVRTPLIESPALNRLVGGRILVKPEVLQRTGSFKFRGAYNCVSQIPEGARTAGVVAFSSGNHAQGVAAAANLLGMPATIVMPSDAPAIKVDSTRAWGAEIVFFDRERDDREAVARTVAAEKRASIVPPYDDPHVIAGQGTTGLEIAADLRALGADPAAVVVPCGSGGLIAGTSIAITAALPGVPIYAAEPAGFDDTTRSLKSGRRERTQPGAKSWCDALLAPTPGEITFAINRKTLSGGLVVTDDAVARAMYVAFVHLKLVVEPGGAVALASVLSGKLAARGQTIVVICSGGNVDSSVFANALQRGVAGLS